MNMGIGSMWYLEVTRGKEEVSDKNCRILSEYLVLGTWRIRERS